MGGSIFINPYFIAEIYEPLRAKGVQLGFNPGGVGKEPILAFSP